MDRVARDRCRGRGRQSHTAAGNAGAAHRGSDHRNGDRRHRTRGWREMTQLASEDAAREQTVLSWRRTALRWVVVAVVAARFFSEEIGAPLIIFALVVIVGAAWL